MIKTTIILFLFASVAIRAEVNDSTARRTDTVRVTASRTFLHAGDNPLTVTVVPKEIITNAQPRQVDELLQFVPGITIQNYGGLGGLKTVSLRGGSSSQTVVLLDGVKLNLVQNGTTDLSTISTMGITAIEVQRGGASALYGGNAISGAVNIITGFSDSTEYTGRIGVGSLNEYTVGATVASPLGKGKIAFSADGTQSRGDYRFSSNQYGENVTLSRMNSDFKYGALSLRYEHSWDALTIRSTSWYRISERGVPGAVLQNVIDQLSARLNDWDFFSTLSAHYNPEKNMTVTGGMLLRKNVTEYSDPDALYRGNNGINDRYNSNSISGYARALLVTSNLLHEYNFEAGFADLNGALVQSLQGEYVKRFSLSGSGRLLYVKEMTDSRLEIQGIARGDYFSDVQFAPSVLTSLMWKHSDNYGMKCSFSHDFRVPNFNEMYYFNFGTRNLKPEFSTTISVGAFCTIFDLCSIEIDVFSSQITDKIIAVPTGPTSWSARNIAKSSNKGIEINAKAELFEKSLLLQYCYTLQDARDNTEPGKSTLLPYVPQEIVSGFALYTIGDISFGGTIRYTSHRFSLGGNQKESLLPHYNIVSMFVNYNTKLFSGDWSIKLSADNITNTEYQLVQNYPMPGRILRFQLSTRW